jgi:L-serine dehydratase
VPVSVFDLLKVGIGPSSSHTVGPMRIAQRFAQGLAARGVLAGVARVQVRLHGSLALTGRGHATDRAVLLGLMGHDPETVDVDRMDAWVDAVRQDGWLRLLGTQEIAVAPSDLVFDGLRRLPQHPNGMRLVATAADGRELADETWFSVGGGFIATAQDLAAPPVAAGVPWPHPYGSADELLRLCTERGIGIARLALENETALRPLAQVRAGLERLRTTMFACMDRGLAARGDLPGGLRVGRRAAALQDRLLQGRPRLLQELDWVNAFAVAVNEENAAGGRVVTAPTNGAAGVLPAVLRFHERLHRGRAASNHD